MNVAEFLKPEHVFDRRASDKRTLIREMAAEAAAVLGLPAEPVTAALLKREDLGCTGLGAGVAIPHARLEQLERPFGMLWRLRPPIEFDAIDGKPVDIVFLLLLPAAGPQLDALASVARKLREPDKLARLRAAPGEAEAYAVLTS